MGTWGLIELLSLLLHVLENLHFFKCLKEKVLIQTVAKQVENTTSLLSQVEWLWRGRGTW